MGLLQSASVFVSQSHASVTWAACCVALGAVGAMTLCMLHVHTTSDRDEQDWWMRAAGQTEFAAALEDVDPCIVP